MLYKKNGDKLWEDAIDKEMNDIKSAFNILEEGKKVTNGYQKGNCFMILGFNMEYLLRKDGLVSDGHVTEPSATTIDVSVVSHETVRVVITLTFLNYLDVKLVYIYNAYITAPFN